MRDRVDRGELRFSEAALISQDRVVDDSRNADDSSYVASVLSIYNR